MFARFRARLTYANVIATLALFTALGGSSYAALNLPKGSVGSTQLQKNSVTSVKVRPGTLVTSDFNASARSRLRGPEGPEGEEGLEGPEGPEGEPGPTEGFAVGAEPDAVPDQVNASEMFTTTTRGRLYITGAFVAAPPAPPGEISRCRSTRRRSGGGQRIYSPLGHRHEGQYLRTLRLGSRRGSHGVHGDPLRDRERLGACRFGRRLRDHPAGGVVTAGTPDDYIASLDEPRRAEIEHLDALIRATLPDLERVLQSGGVGYISLYVLCSEDGAYLTERYVDRLPKANIGKSCVRFKRTSDVDLDVLRELLVEAGRLGPPHPPDRRGPP